MRKKRIYRSIKRENKGWEREGRQSKQLTEREQKKQRKNKC